VISRSEWLGKARDQQGEKLQNGTLVEVRRVEDWSGFKPVRSKKIRGSFSTLFLVLGRSMSGLSGSC
jgi:hypothetical protein